MDRIRYLATISRDPETLAGFYVRYLGLAEIGRNAAGDVTLTDGSFNLTFFRMRRDLREPHLAPGLHHLGIAVESIEAATSRYLAFNPRGVVIRESGDLQHGEARIYDPECNPITLSERDFGLRQEAGGIPRVAHVALNVLDPDRIFDFYTQVFGFGELTVAHASRRKDPNYRNRHVGDGYTNVAIQAFYNEEEGFEPRFGIAHIGFLVEDSVALAKAIENVATLAKRPAKRVQSEIRMRDPEGNGCDLSQRGWEVEDGKWVRGGIAKEAT